MTVELLKDAEGREIPLDTVCMYDNDGKEIVVSRYQYYPGVGTGYWNIKSVRNKYYRQDEVYLTKPDSWEKLEEDLDRCIEADCISHGTSLVLVDIKQRIHNLRGEGK